MIVLVSEEDKHNQDILKAFSIPLHILHYKTTEEAQASLLAEEKDRSLPWLILLDTTDAQDVVSICRMLREDPLYEDVPILMLIDHSQSREEMLNAGADDYLLLPLLGSDIRHKFEAHLNFQICGIRPSPRNNGLEAMAERIDYSHALRTMADGFCASSAWLCLYDTSQNRLKNIAIHHVIEEFHRGSDAVNPIRDLLERFPSPMPFTPNVIPCPKSFHIFPETTHLISIPLENHGGYQGLLVLGYSQPLQLSKPEKRILCRFGRAFENALASDFMNDEVKKFATRNAFLSFITQLISQESDTRKIISLTLEHIVPLLEASRAEIWLHCEDNQSLRLASSLTTSLKREKLDQLENGQGLIGWVADQGKALSTNDPSNNPHFDNRVDQFEGNVEYSLLAVPMRSHETTLGVLAVYGERGRVFDDLDRILLESVANLAASGIAHDFLVKEIDSFAKQQSALLEMSQQIVSGLDLQTSLNRALQWISRLVEIEIGLLWLIDEEQDVVRLVASLGMEIVGADSVCVPLGQGVVGWVGREGESVVINDPENDHRFTLAFTGMLEIDPHHILTLPLRYRGKNLGVLSLINKIGGAFRDVEMTLLSTAADMIAVAVGNARLHTQTLALMEEREKIHKAALQTARLATVGRLTATLSHEINNPMQAIRGALALSMEEIHDTKAMVDYIDLSLREADRVVQLIHRMQQIYNPPSDGSEPFPINSILKDVIAIAKKEFSRYGIKLHTELAPKLPNVTGNIDQLHLVFLCLILTLVDSMRGVGGKDLTIRSSYHSGEVSVEFSGDVPLPEWDDVFGPDSANKLTGTSFGLSFGQDIIVSQGGEINLVQKDPKFIVVVNLPLPNLVE